MTAEIEEGRLKIGDFAPALAVSRFAKGDPLAALPAETVCVIEFWATWCGPCRDAIPHLTDLAKRYPEVVFIGVNVWETELSAVEPFVAKMGDRMDYRVALDTLPEDAAPREGAMATTWLKAAGQRGIPATFVVGADGRIAWIGHPVALEEPLAKIRAGTWDMQAFKKEYEANFSLFEVRMTKHREMRAARKAQDFARELALIEEIIAGEPDLRNQYAVPRFVALAHSGDSKAALAYGEVLLEETFRESDSVLAFLAYETLGGISSSAPPLSPEVAAFVLRVAHRADEIAGREDYSNACVLATAHFACAEYDDGFAAGKRALRLAAANPEVAKDDPGLLDRLRRDMEAHRGKPDAL